MEEELDWLSEELRRKPKKHCQLKGTTKIKKVHGVEKNMPNPTPTQTTVIPAAHHRHSREGGNPNGIFSVFCNNRIL